MLNDLVKAMKASEKKCFAWQAWHSWHWVARLEWLGRPRDARDAAALCVAGMAQPHIHRRFAWQAWHNLTSTAFSVAGVAQPHIHRHLTSTVVLRGRRGATSHPPSFCVAGVAPMALGGALGLAWSPA